VKILVALSVCFVLFLGIAFAENSSVDSLKNGNGDSATNKSKYKTSPKLRYRSDKPAEENDALGALKPMLNQVMGNNPNSTGGVQMPNSGTYSF
jgi:hypothetical protein